MPFRLTPARALNGFASQREGCMFTLEKIDLLTILQIAQLCAYAAMAGAFLLGINLPWWRNPNLGSYRKRRDELGSRELGRVGLPEIHAV